MRGLMKRVLHICVLMPCVAAHPQALLKARLRFQATAYPALHMQAGSKTGTVPSDGLQLI